MEDNRGSDVGICIIISSVTKQAGNNVNPTWPFYFEEIFCVSLYEEGDLESVEVYNFYDSA